MTAIEKTVVDYYTGKLVEHGPTAKGVDWNSEESQLTRFAQLISRFELNDEDSILDYGCGYGALLSFLREHQYNCSYIGFDWAAKMIEEAQSLFSADSKSSFSNKTATWTSSRATYTVASGIFNVMFDHDEQSWKDYVAETIDSVCESCTRGFAFNMLTSYSDPEFKRGDLYYADPCYYFDLCKRRYGKQVALLHDYGLYEFTLIVKK